MALSKNEESEELLGVHSVSTKVENENDINSDSDSSGLDTDVEDDDKYIVKDKVALITKYIAVSFVKQLFLWFVFIYFQHIGSVFLILCTQIYFYKELTKYGIKEEKEAELGWILKGGFRIIYWYWYGLASLYCHWRVLEPQFDLETKQKYHFPTTLKQEADFDFMIFFLYASGLIMFVLTLRKKHYKYQFERFAFCHVLLFIFGFSCLSMKNVFSGLIYFVLPLQLVAVNSSILKLIHILSKGRDDTFSYKHSSFLFRFDSLPNLSFFLGWIVTTTSAFVLTRMLIRFQLFTCTKHDIYPEYWPTCENNDFVLKPLKDFLDTEYVKRFPTFIQNMKFCNFDEHAFWFSQFAAFVSPFGGFFTAAFKRAFKLRTDFGQGPFADRLDCCVLIGVFVFTYTTARVSSESRVLEFLDLSKKLSDTDRLKVYKSLGQYLSENSLLDN